MQQTKFLIILDHFLLFYPLNNPKNQNFEKMKQKSGNIIILHLCTINDNHMMYGSWDIKRDGRIYCYFGLVFAILPPKKPKKSKFWKTEKSTWRCHHFTQVYQKSWSYAILSLRYGAWQTWLLFILGFFFSPFFTRNNAKNEN